MSKVVTNDYNEYEEKPSKSDRKREMEALQTLGAQLTELNSEQLSQIPLSERLQEAIADYKRITSHEAKRRQMQFIGSIMPNEQVDEIKQALQRLQNIRNRSAQQFKQVEVWRDRLITHAKESMTQFVNQYRHCDVQHLRQLVRNAEQEHKQGKPAGAGKALFRYLRETMEVN